MCLNILSLTRDEAETPSVSTVIWFIGVEHSLGTIFIFSATFNTPKATLCHAFSPAPPKNSAKGSLPPKNSRNTSSGSLNVKWPKPESKPPKSKSWPPFPVNPSLPKRS